MSKETRTFNDETDFGGFLEFVHSRTLTSGIGDKGIEKWRGGSRASSIEWYVMQGLKSRVFDNAFTELFFITARRTINPDPATRYLVTQLLGTFNAMDTITDDLIGSNVPLAFYDNIDEETFSCLFRSEAGNQVSMTNIDYLIRLVNGNMDEKLIAIEEKHGGAGLDWSQKTSYLDEMPEAFSLPFETIVCNVDDGGNNVSGSMYLLDSGESCEFDDAESFSDAVVALSSIYS